MSGKDERMVKETPNKKHDKYCMDCTEKRRLYIQVMNGQIDTVWLCGDTCVEQYNEMIRRYIVNEERRRRTSTYIITIPAYIDVTDLFVEWEEPWLVEEMQPDEPISYEQLQEYYRGRVEG